MYEDSIVNRKPWGIDVMKMQIAGMGVVLLVSFSASANPTFNRGSWTHWHGKWGGNFWHSGNFAPQYMTCVATDGSYGSPEYWAGGSGEEAAHEAYQKCLDDVNVANKNPAYIKVYCGY